MARKTPEPSLPLDVARLRARMDRLNARLAADLQARARLALAIARAKAAHGLAAADAEREREMLRRVLERAPEGFARSDLARLFETIFVASRALVLADAGEARVARAAKPARPATRRARRR